jgi:ABC-type sulfate transport system permease component
MNHIIFFVIVAIVYVLFFVHENYRKPIYIYNTWQENDEDTKIARAIVIVMCILSFIGGLLH